jgi:hypothetical protein
LRQAGRKPAKFVARKIHEFVHRQRQHRFLHHMAAPFATFEKAAATEEADASSDRNEVEECA